MWLFAVLSWYWAVVGLGGALNILGANSHNSRLGLLRELACKTLIWLADFTAERRFDGRIGEISR